MISSIPALKFPAIHIHAIVFQFSAAPSEISAAGQPHAILVPIFQACTGRLHELLHSPSELLHRFIGWPIAQSDVYPPCSFHTHALWWIKWCYAELVAREGTLYPRQRNAYLVSYHLRLHPESSHLHDQVVALNLVHTHRDTVIIIRGKEAAASGQFRHDDGVCSYYVVLVFHSVPKLLDGACRLEAPSACIPRSVVHSFSSHRIGHLSANAFLEGPSNRISPNIDRRYRRSGPSAPSI
ncbi:hypothetical protein EDE05_1178 [Neorhizobium sp. R1-B]|nr:hypothetical protein EDE05_1178 [Neorhizobium sp. R1-B]